MSSSSKTIARIKNNGEIFTPISLVSDVLNGLPEEVWKDSTKTFLDNSCGNGNFLVVVKERLFEHGHSFENILSRIYSVDIMFDNCVETIIRLHNNQIVNLKNEIQKVSWFDEIDKYWVSYKDGILIDKINDTLTTGDYSEIDIFDYKKVRHTIFISRTVLACDFGNILYVRNKVFDKILNKKQVLTTYDLYNCAGKFRYNNQIITNIVCADALRYHYRFDGSHPYDEETKKQVEKEAFDAILQK